MIPAFLDRALEQAPGGLGLHYRARKTYRWGDPYIRLVKRLSDPDRLAVDIGAHNGDYTYFMRRYAKGCIAFECNPTLVSLLRRDFGTTIDLRDEAVSDSAGTATLRIPRTRSDSNFGRATIEADNDLLSEFSAEDLVTVRKVKLDDAVDGRVGLMKIDVEGHEIAVLHGAQMILGRDRPSLIVELEERHLSGCVESAIEFLSGFGYTAYILSGERLQPLPASNRPEGLWNYVFLSAPTAARILAS